MAYDIVIADPGGEPWISLGSSGPAGLAISSGAITSAAPIGRASRYAYVNPSLNSFWQWSVQLVGNYQKWIVGWAHYCAGFGTNNVIIQWKDAGTVQCGWFINALGQLVAFRGSTSTVLGSPSTNIFNSLSGWHYFESSVTIASGTAGAIEFKVDGIPWATVTGVNTQNSTNAFAQIVALTSAVNGQNNQFGKDFLVMVDTGAGGLYPGYQGDVSALVCYRNGAGVHQDWTPSGGPFSLTSVNGTGVYQGTVTGGDSNAYVGKTFVITGFVNGANNITAVCTASTATSLSFTATTVVETRAGTASFQSQAEMVNDGINHTGTVPDDDNTYVYSNTTGQISDWAHQSISPLGSILAVIHLTRARKDDAGAQTFRQVCLSGATVEDNGSDIPLGNTPQWYKDILQKDPATSAVWATAGYNAATLGVKK